MPKRPSPLSPKFVAKPPEHSKVCRIYNDNYTQNNLNEEQRNRLKKNKEKSGDNAPLQEQLH